jgi:YYY domain-containing protein
MAIAAGLRFYNINWDNGIFAHPDERSTVAFYAPTIRWPDDETTALLDKRNSRLNPFWNVDRQERRSYTYGHFPLYTLVLVANFLNDLPPLVASLPFEIPSEWLGFLATSLSGQGFARIGRFLVALSDLFSVYLIFLIGRRLYGNWGGLLAAAFSTFTVLQIQLAHFFAVDPISVSFTLLAIYGAILLYDRQSVGAAIITGTGIALAVASKFSALPIVFAPIVAGYLAVRHKPTEPTPPDMSSHAPNPQSPISSTKMIGLVSLALSIAFLVFAFTSPFVLLDFENFERAVLDEQGNMVSGVADFPFTRQFRQTTAYWYFIEQQLRWGMGWSLGLLGLAGTLWVIIKAVRGQAQVGELLALLWLILYFGPTGLFLAKFMRYMVPVVPLFSLFGAGLIIALWQARLEAKSSAIFQLPFTQKVTKAAAIMLAIIVVSSAAFWSLAFTNGVYGTEHTWVTFARWTYSNVPDGSCIAYEHWDDRMPSDIPEPDGYPGAHQYYQPILPMYDDDTQQKYELLRDTLMNCDYVVLASNRLWRTIPRLPKRYPMSMRYYQALFSGELGFEQVYSAETPPGLGSFVFDDQAADESFTVYDHPKPIMFKKIRQLSPAEWDGLLGHTWQGATRGYVGPTTLLMRLRGATDNFAPQPQALQTAKTGKSLLLDSPVDQLPPLNDYRWNDIANNSPLVATVVWWFILMSVGMMTFPLTFLLFNKLPDRGYSLSKSLGLLLISYFVWVNSSLNWFTWLGNTLTTAIIAIILFITISLLVLIRYRRQLGQFWHERRPFILTTEVVFSLVYLLFVYVRVLNPDLWHPWLGGEKMLEIGFLNAIVKSAQMPPYDPFFAGGVVNYYYYGLFLVGVLIKLSGIQPSIAFNLAVPALAALTAINAFSLAGNLAIAKSPFVAPTKTNASNLHIQNPKSKIQNLKSISAGLLAALFIVFMGNLEGAAQFMRNLANLNISDVDSAIPGLATLLPAITGLGQALSGESIATYNYWDPTRVIPETINEFPFFSFLFADLHPHMIGIPFTVLFLSLAYNWLRPHSPPSSRFPALLRWLAIPFVLGAIGVINTWDLPTYLGLMVATFLLSRYRQGQGTLTLPQVGILLANSVLFAGALLAVAYLLYAPFFANYQPPAETGVGLVHTKTPLDQHLKIWGISLFIIGSWLWLSLLHPASRNSLLRVVSLVLRRWNVWPHLTEIYRSIVKRESDAYQLGLWSIGLVVLLTLGLIILGYRVPAYLLPLVSLALILLFRREISETTAYLGLLIFTGLLVLLGIEFFFLRDFLGGGDYYRMNTLFKFFIQVWIIFGIAAAVTLPQIWGWAWRWSWPHQIIWRGAVMILLLAGLVYPIFGTRTRIDDRFPGRQNRPPIGTLDGLAYMTAGIFEWPAGNPIHLKYDYQAIRWLQDNVEGTPILAEAKIGYYREGGMRVAAYTGLPSILGGLHQNEQRYSSQVGSRDLVVNEFWLTPDPIRTAALIDELNISYIYIGQVERATYGPTVGRKFEDLRHQGRLELVFENEETKIYKRRV